MEKDEVRILCYGDSNTWGYIAGTAERFGPDVRWTGRLKKLLPENYTVIEDGINGRTTVYDNLRNSYLNGLKGLGYSLIAQKPLDLVILFLGTNDLHYTGAVGTAYGMDEIVRTVQNADGIYRVTNPIFPKGPKILLVAPVPLHPDRDRLVAEDLLTGKAAESKRLAGSYEAIARQRGVYFLNAGLYGEPSPVDGVHLTADSHKALALAMADKIKEIFPWE